MASFLSLSLAKPVIARASSSPVIITSSPESLEERFGRKGIKFLEYNSIPSVELTVRNGSSLRLQIPDAHVTSYKPKVSWKEDGLHELLYTIPSGDGEGFRTSKGGVGLVMNSDGNSLIDSGEWIVKDVDSDSFDAVQVELSCANGTLEMRYVVSLYPLSMATAIIVKNNGSKTISLTSAILSHVKLKKRGRSGLEGLFGCNYVSMPPPASNFEILSPAEAMKPESPGWLDFSSENEEKPGIWNEQNVPIAILKKKMSRVYCAKPEERLKPIYNTTPSKYEILDQGTGLFFRVIRIGYEEVYVGTPGGLHEKYGSDYFVCTGPAAMVVPVTLNPGEEWRGAQVIQHDNL